MRPFCRALGRCGSPGYTTATKQACSCGGGYAAVASARVNAASRQHDYTFAAARRIADTGAAQTASHAMPHTKPLRRGKGPRPRAIARQPPGQLPKPRTGVFT